jgi:hypothetical protein
MLLDLFTGVFDIFPCAVNRPASRPCNDQDGRRKECKHETFDHKLLFLKLNQILGRTPSD